MPIKYTVIFLLIVIAGCSISAKTEFAEEESPVVSGPVYAEIKPEIIVDDYNIEYELYDVEYNRVQKNESFYVIFKKIGLNEAEILQAQSSIKKITNPSKIKAGQKYIIYKHKNRLLKDRKIVFHIDELLYFVLHIDEDFRIEKGEKTILTKIKEASGSIRSSLYETLLADGNSTILAYRLSDVFAWQIDFFRLYKNDSFKVIYEEKYIGDTFYDIGKVLAAEFHHKGEKYSVYYFEGEDRIGYYDEEGNSVQKALLKAPFKFSQRISSGFSNNRFHPVLKTNRPHHGVDYAAPRGTPVIAVGDGKIVEARYRGANGNIVQIQHNSVYKTAYLHLQGFAKGIKSGVSVKQGQVIGYVGATGRVTGVHLDYRVYKNGNPVNPLSLKLPPSESVSNTDKAAFFELILRLKARINDIGEEVEPI